MLASALIVFREVFEAGLVIGIVLSATRGVRGRGLWVGGGLLAGVVGACLVALFAGAIGDALEGAGQEVLNGAVLLIASVMLGWHNIWMARHGREIATELRTAGRAVAEGRSTLLALAVVVGVAVLREGSEIVLFLYGIVAGGSSLAELVVGGALGVAGGALVTLLLYLGLVAIPMHRLFAVTSVMLSLLAAGMAAQGIGFLIQGDLLPSWGWAWDTSFLLNEKSWVGSALHALAGYTSHPAVLQVAVYAAVLALLLLGGRAATPRVRTLGSTRNTAST